MRAKPGRIRAALLGWLGKPFGLTDADAWAALSGASVGGVQVNAQTMLTISAVWACASRTDRSSSRTVCP